MTQENVLSDQEKISILESPGIAALEKEFEVGDHRISFTEPVVLIRKGKYNTGIVIGDFEMIMDVASKE